MPGGQLRQAAGAAATADLIQVSPRGIALRCGDMSEVGGKPEVPEARPNDANDPKAVLAVETICTATNAGNRLLNHPVGALRRDERVIDPQPFVVRRLPAPRPSCFATQLRYSAYCRIAD
jgi:hypothetical protein